MIIIDLRCLGTVGLQMGFLMLSIELCYWNACAIAIAGDISSFPYEHKLQRARIGESTYTIIQAQRSFILIAPPHFLNSCLTGGKNIFFVCVNHNALVFSMTSGAKCKISFSKIFTSKTSVFKIHKHVLIATTI